MGQVGMPRDDEAQGSKERLFFLSKHRTAEDLRRVIGLDGQASRWNATLGDQAAEVLFILGLAVGYVARQAQLGPGSELFLLLTDRLDAYLVFVELLLTRTQFLFSIPQRLEIK